MGAPRNTATAELTVMFKVTVTASDNSGDLTVDDFFDHEIKDALMPDVSLLDAMLDDAGLPLRITETCPV
jgi:hypothetical protein